MSQSKRSASDVDGSTPAIELLRIDSIHPSPENDQLYAPVDPYCPDFVAMVESVKADGILDPLAVSLDDYIASGHRRYAAARAAGLQAVPCRRIAIRRLDSLDEWVKTLAKYNRQRIKTRDERIREEAAQISADEAYAHLKEFRRQQSDLSDRNTIPVKLKTKRARKKVSTAKQPFLAAVVAVVKKMKEFWPLSDRQIHYGLLNDPPLRNTKDKKSRYDNTKRSYKDLTDILTRARLTGDIAWAAIADPTRPFTRWGTWRESGAFVRQKTDEFLKGFWRDLLQSQPAHIELVAEKMTVQSTVERAAQDYTIPVTVGRGYCSIEPRRAMANRFKASGRERLIILCLSDHDPDGESITESFIRSLRDDFDIAENKITGIKVGLTADQVKRYQLPKKMTAKESSSQAKAFKKEHGENVWELEALSPDVLEREIREAIDRVIDREAFEFEQRMEIEDAQHLEGVRRAAISAIGGAV